MGYAAQDSNCIAPDCSEIWLAARDLGRREHRLGGVGRRFQIHDGLSTASAHLILERDIGRAPTRWRRALADLQRVDSELIAHPETHRVGIRLLWGLDAFQNLRRSCGARFATP
jgi:hypothetical protein